MPAAFIGLKNDPDRVAELLTYFDLARTENCFAEGWRQTFRPFTQAGTQTGTQKLKAILKQCILGAWRQSRH